MQLVNRLRKQHYTYQKPQKPKLDKDEYKYEVLGSTSDRAQYFMNYSREEDYDYNEEDNEGLVNEDQSISLKEVNDLIKKKGLNEKNIHFMAAFDEDYLVLQIVHVHKMSNKEKLEKYEQDVIEWEAQEKRVQQYEEQKIQWEMENLQRRADELKKKNLKRY